MKRDLGSMEMRKNVFQKHDRTLLIEELRRRLNFGKVHNKGEEYDSPDQTREVNQDMDSTRIV